MPVYLLTLTVSQGGFYENLGVPLPHSLLPSFPKKP